VKFRIYLHLSEHTLKLCGISFSFTWTSEARSIHKFGDFFKVKKRLTMVNNEARR
jgi:hypothetical protein